MQNQFDLIIAGGGVSGSALALALGEAGLRVALVDPSDGVRHVGTDYGGRAYALALASTRLFSTIGVWKNVSENAQPICEIKASDGCVGQGASPFFLHFESSEIEEGPMGFILEERYLCTTFMDMLVQHENIETFLGDSIVGQQVSPSSVLVSLASGGEIQARLLVGCDGRTSGVAKCAGIKRYGWNYDQIALVCTISHHMPHHGVAHQFFMPSGPLAILPLPDTAGKHRSSIVWSESVHMAQAISGLTVHAYLEALQPRIGDFMGDISLEGSRFHYPLSLSLAADFVRERIALVGDAAHGVHPVAGQGLNLGLRDAGALAEVLVNAVRRGEDIGSLTVLERYQRWRRPDTFSLAFGMDGVNRLFSNDHNILRLARDLGMGIISELPWLRCGLMRQAAGLSGRLPKLLAGQAL